MAKDVKDRSTTSGSGVSAVLSNARSILTTMVDNLRADTSNREAHAINVTSLVIGVAIVTVAGKAWVILGWLFILGAVVGFADAIAHRVRA